MYAHEYVHAWGMNADNRPLQVCYKEASVHLAAMYFNYAA
jgi:hypothetical protein